MAMFDKPTAGTDSPMSPGTVVGGNVKLTGTLKDVSDITVHGQVEGEIISDRVVTIAETARVKGPITATIITISGTVNGAITASERCELLPSARVTGSVATADLSIKSGAVFNGKATMTVSEKPEVTRNEVAEPEPLPEPILLESVATEEPAEDESASNPGPAATPTAPTAEFED